MIGLLKMSLLTCQSGWREIQNTFLVISWGCIGLTQGTRGYAKFVLEPWALLLTTPLLNPEKVMKSDKMITVIKKKKLYWCLVLIFICHIPLFRLLSKEFVLLKCLGKYFPFECTVGQNGRVWINSSSTSHTITIANAITNSEYMTNDQIQTMVKQLMRGVQA